MPPRANCATGAPLHSCANRTTGLIAPTCKSHYRRHPLTRCTNGITDAPFLTRVNGTSLLPLANHTASAPFFPPVHYTTAAPLYTQALVSELRMASPSVARLADLAVWREREAFEEKTRRALVLLRRKDAKIRALGEAAARRRLKVDARSAAGEECSGGGGGGSKEDGGGGGGGGAGGDGGGDENSVVARLERCLQEREGQIDILLEEVSGMGCQRIIYRHGPELRYRGCPYFR